MGLEENSYRLHEKSFAHSNIEKELLVYKNWFDSNTTDVWRHKRMLSVLNPFLNNDPAAKWLTVGDGRFGTSAIYINRYGGKATATDLDLSLLDVAKKNGMLTDIAYANAEKLPFENDTFDYSYCKQAYHHFPRPIIAVYEMLRISSKAIIYTEPHDFVPTLFTRTLLQKIKHGIKKITGAPVPHHDTGNFESAGNYVYSISVREFEKIALGIGLPCMAFKRFDDIYLQGVEKEVFSERAPLYKKIKSKLISGRIKTLLGVGYPNTVQMILFKKIPDTHIEKELKLDGYTIIHFPKNPYLQL